MLSGSKRSFTTMAQNLKSFTAKSLSGADVSLAQYAGKPVLIENIASL